MLVEEAAKAVASSYVQMGYPVRILDRRGQRVEWAGVAEALVRPVPVVEPLELA
ncbi:hypothetical protein QBC98_005541 [Kitasatospora acidiphila]